MKSSPRAMALAKQWFKQIISTTNGMKLDGYAGLICDLTNGYGKRIAVRLYYLLGLPDDGVREMIKTTFDACKKENLIPATVISQPRMQISCIFMPEIKNWKQMFSQAANKEFPIAVVTEGLVHIIKHTPMETLN
jgi:hypothetical protein